MAVFSFRYDHHLVPALIENISPFVDGWIALDDRGNSEPLSTDAARQARLLDAARAAGADWILAVDPDERYEARLADCIHLLTAVKLPVVWSFRLRELYTPGSYRTDGLWGRKRQARLFPLLDQPASRSALSGKKDFHDVWHPRGYAHWRTDINLYHLKMIDPARRVRRRDVYSAIDPDNRYQAIGYAYLADESGRVLEPVPRNRAYHPPHVDDGRPWMVEPDALLGRAR